MADQSLSLDIILTADERTPVEQLTRLGRTRANLSRRARIILRLDGASDLDIERGLAQGLRTVPNVKEPNGA